MLESIHFRNFAIVPEGIYFIPVPDFAEPDWAFSIRFLDSAGGRVELISQLPRNVYPRWGLSVSPDRTSVLYSQLDNASSDLMLIEGFE